LIPATRRFLKAPGPEVELLLCCARVRLEPDTAERIRELLRRDLDWAHLIRTAREHGTVPLLYWNLNLASPEVDAEGPGRELRSHFQANASRTLLLTDELRKLLRLFESHGIPAVAFKGPALAASVYGNLALRQAGDLDVLVQPDHLEAAKQLLLENGFRLTQHDWARAQVREMASLRRLAQYNVVFSFPKEVAVLELHWAIGPTFFWLPKNPGWLWDGLQTEKTAWGSALGFAPENTLLALCVHGSKHQWERLSWICDVAEFVRVHSLLDWRKLLDRAAQLRCERMVLLGLLLAQDLLGSVLPPCARERLARDTVVDRLAALVCDRLFDRTVHSGRWGRNRFTTLSISLDYIAYCLRLQERLVAKLHGGLSFLRLAWHPTPQDREFLRLPERLSFLYYLFRPVRLAGTYTLRLATLSERVRKRG